MTKEQAIEFSTEFDEPKPKLIPMTLGKPSKVKFDSYIIDDDKLRWLLERKVFTKLQYVYFALKIDYPNDPNPDIEIDKFCDKWDLSYVDLDKAIAQLQEKDVLCRIAKQLELRLFDNDKDDES